MSIRTAMLRSIVVSVCLQPIAGCGPLEAICTEDSLQTFCADGHCPRSPQAAIEQACRDYPQVWRDRESVIIGINSGFQVSTYHYREGELVGIEWTTDVVTLRDAGECPRQTVYGEIATDVLRLDAFGDNGPGCIAGADCITSCTFCADHEQFHPRCSDEVLESTSY